MKSVVEQLSKAELEALVRLYGSDSYAALKRLLELERFNIATKCLEAPDYETVRFLHGQEYALKNLNLLMKSIHNKDKKN